MAKNHSPTRGTAEKETAAGAVSTPLGLPTAPPVEVWDELAAEAARYISLLEAWRAPSPHQTAEQRLKTEKFLLDSLSHLQMHSQVLNESVEEALDLADQLEEREQLEHH